MLTALTTSVSVFPAVALKPHIPRLYQKLKMVYQDRTHRALSNEYLFNSIPCFHSSRDAKFRFFIFFGARFAYRLYQKLEMICQDRTHRALSNGYLFSSISCFHFSLNAKSRTESGVFHFFPELDSPTGYNKN